MVAPIHRSLLGVRWLARGLIGATCVALLAGACGGRDESTGMRSDGGQAGTGPTDQAGAPDNPGGGGSDDPGGGGEGGVTVSMGGEAGSGDLAGSGGSGDVVRPPVVLSGDGTLGSPCTVPADCQMPLTCITATSMALGSGSPPHGLCTASCQQIDDQCPQLAPGAVCYPFGPEGAPEFCVEGCAFGEPAIGELKCHDRPDFACNPALLGDTFTPCTLTEDCLSGELCIDGTCAIVFSACLPSCRGDLDCPADLYCDQAFLSGVCVPTRPTGKALGEPCTVPGALDPAEPDGCLGFCQADATGSGQGHCAVTCGLLSECAWNSANGKFDGACFYASILTSETGFIGDFGFCTPACNCTEECNDPLLACQLLSQGELTDAFRGPGLCFAPDLATTEYDQCQ